MKIDPDRLRYRAEKALMTRSLIDFHRAAWSHIDPATYVHGKHLEVLAEHLEAVSRGQIKRLLVNVPFRTSKSSMIAVSWPAWDWIEHPSRQWYTLSHGERLAIRDNRKMRVVVQSDWYQHYWPLGFADDQDEKKNFINDFRGRRQCAGLDSGLTGDGGDIVLIDDPMDRDQAESDTEREELNLSFDEKVYSRLNDQVNGAFVIIGQRLHENDLFGHLLARGGWDHLCLPMRFEKKHPTPSRTFLGGGEWRKEEGELLWPDKFPEAVVQDLEATLGSYASEGQLQQRPKGRKGEHFQREWFEIVPELPAGYTRYVRYWDCASSEDLANDRSAGVAVATKGDITYVADVRFGHWNPTARLAAQEAAAIADVERVQITDAEEVKRRAGEEEPTEEELANAVPSWSRRVELWEEEEGGSSGKEVAQKHRDHFRRFGMRTERQTGNKEARILMLVPDAENGKIKLVQGAWNKALIDELVDFPRAKNDDIADALAGAYAKARLTRRWAYAGIEETAASDKKLVARAR